MPSQSKSSKPIDIQFPAMPKEIAMVRELFQEYERSLGFQNIEPYYSNPVTDALYMELDLSHR